MTQLSLYDELVIRPVDPHLKAEDLPRLYRQSASVLARLRRGPATNMDLIKIATRFGARIKDLRAAGWVIKTERGLNGLYLYTLISEPVREPSK